MLQIYQVAVMRRRPSLIGTSGVGQGGSNRPWRRHVASLRPTVSLFSLTVPCPHSTVSPYFASAGRFTRQDEAKVLNGNLNVLNCMHAMHGSVSLSRLLLPEAFIPEAFIPEASIAEAFFYYDMHVTCRTIFDTIMPLLEYA